MLTIEEAFRKFKSRLELNQREQDNASKRHNEVRDYLRSKFDVDQDFLTGSYIRHTKTKPLKDIDIFFVLGDKEKRYRAGQPSQLLDAFTTTLADKYGSDAVRKQARSVNVDFGIVVDAEDNTDYRVISIDAVPAFAVGEHYEIPDGVVQTWMKTNPKIHEDRAVKAHQAYSNEWKGLVRMAKYWNNHKRHGEKPVKPSFLIEVMALECLYGSWGGRFDYEMQGLFNTMADRVIDVWPDPAGLGPAVSEGMNPQQKERARVKLHEAARQTDVAIELARKGRNGEALKAWRELFGPKFPLS